MKVAKEMDARTALEKMAAYCASAEHCAQEVRLKLMRLGLAAGDIETVLGRLRAEDFINEQRYCVAFVRDKARFQHWGPLKIRQALLSKGLSESLVDRALEAVEEPECNESLQESLERYLVGRLRRLRGRGMEPPRLKASLLGSALQRGFDYETARDAVERVLGGSF